MIRRAKILEITDILTLTKACAAYMIQNGIYQWNNQYPSKEVFENDIKRQELYVLNIDNLTRIIHEYSIPKPKYMQPKNLRNPGVSKIGGGYQFFPPKRISFLLL